MDVSKEQLPSHLFFLWQSKRWSCSLEGEFGTTSKLTKLVPDEASGDEFGSNVAIYETTIAFGTTECHL